MAARPRKRTLGCYKVSKKVLQGTVTTNVTTKFMLEKKIESRLVSRWQKKTGGWCVKFPPIFFAGFPDRICLAPDSLIIFVETKAPGKVPRMLQDRIIGTLRRWGFRVEVLDTIEKVDTFIDTL